MLLLLLLPACWTPQETSATGMVGRVYDADGKPVGGLLVETEEARAQTDGSGQFAVSYKSPTQFAFFEHAGLTFTRRYQPADDGKVLDLRLPPVAPRAFSCEMDQTCEVSLTWDLGEGLEATLRATCDATEPIVSFPAPVSGLPVKASCRAQTGPDQELRAVEGNELYPPPHVRILPPPVELSVKLSTSELPLPRSCTVYADGRAAELSGEGRWVVPTFGRTMLHAVCDGLPGTPRMVIARGPGETALTWSPTTPALDARARVPGAQRLRLLKAGGRDRGWSLQIEADKEGTFVLPRLSEGTYVFGFDLPLAELHKLHPAEDLPPGVLQLTDVPDPDGNPLRVGLLKLDTELTSGSIPLVAPRR